MDPNNHIWKKSIDLDTLNGRIPALDRHCGIEFIEIGPDFLRARMQVNANTHQPAGLLHGGASCVLIETMGSVGAVFAVPEGKTVVGTDLTASHLRGVKSGCVIGEARPLKTGRRMQFWQINISQEDGAPVCASKLTVAVIDELQA